MAEERLRYIIRVMNADLNGNKNVVYALNKIKGVSYGFANAICNVVDIDKSKRAGALTPDEIKSIEDVIINPQKYNIPTWMFNRRKDYDTGGNQHLIGAKLELRTDLDIKNLKKIKSYRGIRHSMGLPTRGQRTRAHFRKGTSIGVQKKRIAAQSAKEKKE